MPKSTSYSNSFLNLTFQATTITGIAQNAGTSPLTNLYVSLHTANPGVGGSQTTSEAAYTGYARVAVARTSSGWTTATSGSVNPAAAINFPAATGGSETETYFAIGTAATGTGVVLYVGTVTPNIAVASGVQPQLTTATTVSEA